MVCETPDLGRIKKVGLFLLDDCMAPIFGPASGYIDDCPAGIETSDNIDDGEEFTRRCADGSIKRFIPGVKSLQSIEVNVDFHWLDPEWVASAGGAQPIVNNGEVIGWSDCTRDRFNVLVVVEQEILGSDACSGDVEEGSNSFIRLYPVKGARLSEDGDIGSEDNVIRLTGETTDSTNLESGPIPLAWDSEEGEAVWLSDCLPSGCHRYRFTGAPLPEVCGSYDTEEPPSPCTPAS